MASNLQPPPFEVDWADATGRITQPWKRFLLHQQREVFLAGIVSYAAKSGNYTIVPSTDAVINATGSVTITLPTAVGLSGRSFVIKNSGTATVTVATTSSQTIDGATTARLSVPYTSITVLSTNANWIII